MIDEKRKPGAVGMRQRRCEQRPTTRALEILKLPLGDGSAQKLSATPTGVTAHHRVL
jgi:hypothetical protein